MLLAIAVIVAIAGTFFAIYYINKKKNAAAMTWPETAGRVTVSMLDHDISKDKDWDGDSVKTKTYTPRIHFEYTVGDTIYTGKRVAYRNLHSVIKGVVQKTLDRYPVGAAVTVYYDPQNPSDSVLERKA